MIVSAALLVPSAQGYDGGSCGSGASWDDIDQFRISAGEADFGDNPHVAGAPVGTAVVCWDRTTQSANATRARLIGNLYRDSGISPSQNDACAIGRISFLNAAGQVRATRAMRPICGPGGLKAARVDFSATAANRVRIELSRHYPCCGNPQVVRVVTVRFPD